MSRRENESNRLKDLIPQMLKENKLQKGMDQMRVSETWAEIMGPGVMNYTESVTLKGQTIFVRLNSSALREELEYGKDKIIKMLNESLEDIPVKSLKLF